MMHLRNATVYHKPQNKVPPGMRKERRCHSGRSTGETMPVSYPAPAAIGATGRLYSGKFRVAPASFSGQP